MVDSRDKKNEAEYDMDRELSTLVEKKIIPSKLAEKLSTKLKQKNIKLTKSQLYLLVNKINEVMQNLKNFNKTKTDFEKPYLQDNKPITTFNEDQDMQRLVESIEKL